MKQMSFGKSLLTVLAVAALSAPALSQEQSTKEIVFDFLSKNRTFTYGDNKGLDSYVMRGKYLKSQGEDGTLVLLYDLDGKPVKNKKWSDGRDYYHPELLAVFSSNKEPEAMFSYNSGGRAVRTTKYYPKSKFSKIVKVDFDGDGIYEKMYQDMNNDGYMESIWSDLDKSGDGERVDLALALPEHLIAGEWIENVKSPKEYEFLEMDTTGDRISDTFFSHDPVNNLLYELPKDSAYSKEIQVD